MLCLAGCAGEFDDSDLAEQGAPGFAEGLEFRDVEPPRPTYPQYAQYAPTDRVGSVAVGDDFNRHTSAALGAGYGGFTWEEETSTLENDEHVSIAASDHLSLHYFASGTSRPHTWAVMGTVQLRDGEVQGRAHAFNEHYMTGRPFGFSYRLQGTAVDHDDPGYHVLVTTAGVQLMAGATQVAVYASAIDAGWHEYRVEFVGDRHRVFMDGREILNVVDTTYTSAGRVGVAGYYSVSEFDDIVARALPIRGVGTPVADDFERTDGAALRTGSVGVQWREEGDADDHVSVQGGALQLHYFAGGSSHPRAWAVIDDLALENVELRVRARGYNAHYMTDRPFGLSYRLQGAKAEHDAPGYHVLITSTGVRLMAGATEVAAWSGAVDANWHDYRVEAVGDTHRVFIDGEKKIEVNDDSYPSAGKVGVAGYYTIASFEHFSARALPVAGVDPRSLDMTLFYWSVEPDQADTVRDHGVNMCHAYLTTPQALSAESAAAAVEDYVAGMAAEGMRVMATVGGQFVTNHVSTPSVEDDVMAAILALDGYGNVTFWYLPEELRYWWDAEGSEYFEGVHLMQWTQAHDPQLRPAAMYSPNHAGRSRYYAEFEWSHVLIGGAYVGYDTMDSMWTLGWARWKARELMSAVHGAYHLGSDHGDGGRTPMIASWCSSSEPNYGAVEAYNFVFATLAEGARGVGVWSYFHGIEEGSPDCLAGHAAAFDVLQDATHPLGRALLHGTRDPRLTVTVTAGAAETLPFQNGTIMPPETLPSVVATLVFFEGKRYIVAANSRSDEVTVAFSGAGRTGQVEVLTEGRDVAMVNGGFGDTFAGKAVHVYALPPG